ncbi:hypothetical protein XPA_003373 [Xanthoria parietina]
MDHTMMFCASDPGIVHYPVFTHLQVRYEEGSHPHIKSASDLDCFLNRSFHIGPDSDVGPHEQGFGYSMPLLGYFMGGCAGCLGTKFSALGDRLQICTNDECGTFGSKGKEQLHDPDPMAMRQSVMASLSSQLLGTD